MSKLCILLPTCLGDKPSAFASIISTLKPSFSKSAAQFAIDNGGQILLKIGKSFCFETEKL